MLKKIFIAFVICLTACQAAYCQSGKVIDQNIDLIRTIPNSYQMAINKIKKNDRKSNDPAYQRILALGTPAIPGLIDKMADTTFTSISNKCTHSNLRTGDIAFCLLNDIALIPWHAVTGSQWDNYSGCGIVPDGGWSYLENHRKTFQQELRVFFQSDAGKLWIRMLNGKLSKPQNDQLKKEL